MLKEAGDCFLHRFQMFANTLPKSGDMPCNFRFGFQEVLPELQQIQDYCRRALYYTAIFPTPLNILRNYTNTNESRTIWLIIFQKHH